MSTYVLGVTVALAVTVFVLEMLRRGYLKEKFAALWLVVCLTLLVVAIFPSLLRSAADLLGVEVPSNLLFLGAGLLLLVVSVQLSHEVSRVEARTRRLAEEVALLRESIAELKKRD